MGFTYEVLLLAAFTGVDERDEVGDVDIVLDEVFDGEGDGVFDESK